MTQRIHNLVKHALAGFDVQLLRGRIRRRMRLGVGKSVAHEFLFPMQRFDLQLLESLRIGIADALLQSSDALGVLVDYHQNRTAILCVMRRSIPPPWRVTHRWFTGIISVAGILATVRGQ